jgi:hypothetical protein
MLKWIKRLYNTRRIKLVLRAEHDIWLDINDLADDIDGEWADVFDSGLHALRAMIAVRQGGGQVVFVDDSLTMTTFNPNYLNNIHGQSSDHVPDSGGLCEAY